MQLPKKEEPDPTNGLYNNILYPNVEEEVDISRTQVESTEDPGLFESHILLGSSILSSEEDTTIEEITPTNSVIDQHLPSINIRKRSIDISDMPPDLPSSLPKRRKRINANDSQNSSSTIIIPDGQSSDGRLSNDENL